MGVLNFGADENASRPAVISERQSSDQESNKPAGLPAWAIALIVIGVIAVMAITGFMLWRYITSRRRQAKGFRPVEQVIPRHWGPGKLSSDERRKVEEQERDMMIRKSLATRPSSAVDILGLEALRDPSMAEQNHVAVDEPEERPEERHEDRPLERPDERPLERPEEGLPVDERLDDDQSDVQSETAGLKEDWKAWEARIRDERRLSNSEDVGLNHHPAFAAIASSSKQPQPEASRMI